MTKNEFIRLNDAEMQRHDRHSLKVCIVGVCILGSLIPGVLWLVHYIDRMNDAAGLVKALRYSILGVSGLLSLLLAFGLSRMRQQFGVPCPHCKRRMAQIGARIL